MAKPELKALRQGMGTVRSIANDMDIHYSYLSGVENQKRLITVDNATRIAQFFGCTIADLFIIAGWRGVS